MSISDVYILFLAIRADSALLSTLGDQLDDYHTLNDLRDAVSHSGLDIAASVGQLDELIGSKQRLLELLKKIQAAKSTEHPRPSV